MSSTTIEAQLLLALDAGGMAAWEISDAEGTLVWRGPGTGALAEALGTSVPAWLDEISGDEGGVDSVGDAGPPEATRRKVFQIVGADGQARGVEVRARRVADGGCRRWAGIVAEAGEGPRWDFPATLIHELRNPLATLLISAQLLRRHGRNRPELLDAVSARIERQATYLNRLIGEISEWSQICRGTLEFSREILEPAKILARAAAECRLLLEELRQDLAMDIPPVPLKAYGDPARLAGVLGKLLARAAAYTPEGGKIRLALIAGGQVATIRVSDGGEGIDPAVLERVFEPFFQIAYPLHPGNSGLGLGLAVAKYWVEGMGGTITVRNSGEGRGSEFAIQLPLA